MKSNNTINTNNKLRLFFLALIVIAVGATLFGSSIARLTYAVIHREGSGHGVFVPFLSAFFLWIRRDTLVKTEMRYDLLGIPISIAGLLFPIFSIGPYNLQILGFLIFISGVIIIFLGRSFYKVIFFPVLFLITLIPIPDNTWSRLAETIRIISFSGAQWLISMLGIPSVREGNFIHFHNATLLVAEGCSGIRYLVSYFVFSIAYAYIYRERLWSRIAVVCSSIFISLFASVMRLASIFMLVYSISPWWGQRNPHIFFSWSVFFIVLIIAITLDQHFQKKFEKTRHD